MNITFSDWVIVRKYYLCASVDNHIPRDDIFDYHPTRERNIYIILPICFCHRGTFSILFYKFDKFEIDF